MINKSEPDKYFRKFHFKTALECPTRLFYHARNYPQNQQREPFIAHIRMNKRLMSRLMKLEYSDGISVESDSTRQAADETENYLQRSDVVLFNAVLLKDSLRAKFPILEKEGGRLKFYQIHTRAFDPDHHRFYTHHGKLYSKWKNYLFGVAYQYYVLSKCYPESKITPHFILPRKNGEANHAGLHQKLNNGELNPSEENDLLVKVDVSREVESILEGEEFDKPFAGQDFEAVIQQLFDHFESDKKYPVAIGKKCRDCEFRIEKEREEEGVPSGFSDCWKEVYGDYDGEPLVFDLIGPGTEQWLQQNIFLQRNVPDSDIEDLETITSPESRITENHRQSLQIMRAKNRKVPEEIIKPQLFDELQKWSYPIHFVDFEAGNYALPLRNNRSPYDLVVFQYSCHTLFEDGSWKHHQWIDPMSGDYPNPGLIRALKNVPQILEGTLVQYSQFERYALKTLRKELKRMVDPPDDVKDLIIWIEQIIDRHDSNNNQKGSHLADLGRLVKHFYYNNQMDNSLSIKDVLHSVMKVSPHLEKIYSEPYSSSNFDEAVWFQRDKNRNIKNPYNVLIDMEGQGVQRGTEAMVAYAQALTEPLDSIEKKQMQKSLLRYCELDTLAMMMIFQHWKNSV